MGGIAQTLGLLDRVVGEERVLDDHRAARDARHLVDGCPYVREVVSRDPRHLLSVGLWRPFSRLHGRFTAGELRGALEAAGFVNCQVEETFGGLGLLASARRP